MKFEEEVYSYKGRTRDLITALKRAGYNVKNRSFSIRQRVNTIVGVVTDSQENFGEIVGYIDDYRGLNNSQPAVLVTRSTRLREFARNYKQ